jgi:hypothetical protein
MVIKIQLASMKTLTNYDYVPETHIMYLYGAVDFLNDLKKGCWGGGSCVIGT